MAHAAPGQAVPENFEAVAGRIGDDVVVVLRGELDLAGTPSLSRAIDAIGDGAVMRVVLDLSNLAFIDAAGIGAIERATDELYDRGVGVIVRNPQPAVRRVLALCGLESWIEASGAIGAEAM